MAITEFPIITNLGGREAVQGKFVAHGVDVTLDAMRMWTVRKSIPGDAMRLLMAIAEEEEAEYSAADFELAGCEFA